MSGAGIQEQPLFKKCLQAPLPRSRPSSLVIFSMSVPKMSFSSISEPGTGYVITTEKP